MAADLPSGSAAAEDVATPLRVLVLSHLYPRGTEPTSGIFVHEQVVALRRRGVDARVLSGDVRWLNPRRPLSALRALGASVRPARRPAWAVADGVPHAFVPYTVPRGLWSRVGPRRYRAAMLHAAVALRPGFAFDLVHAHTACLDGFAAAALADRFEAPFVLTEHSGPFRTQTRTSALRHATGSAVERAERVVAVSRALMRDIELELAPSRRERLCVIPNGVDTQRFHPGPDGPPADGTVRAVWIGHLVPIKQPLLLLGAFALARREDPRLRLALVGEGPLEGTVRARVRELGLEGAVALHPFADRDGVAAHLARSHFLVLASAAETFGVVVIEALACGRPVLSTRCGGPEDVLVDPRLGELVEDTPEALARGFVSLARRCADFDPEWIRDHAIESYGYARLAERLELLYRDVLRPCAPLVGPQ